MTRAQRIALAMRGYEWKDHARPSQLAGVVIPATGVECTLPSTTHLDYSGGPRTMVLRIVPVGVAPREMSVYMPGPKGIPCS